MNISTSRGFALPTAVMALVILAVLITGAIYMAQQEYRVGWSAEQVVGRVQHDRAGAPSSS